MYSWTTITHLKEQISGIKTLNLMRLYTCLKSLKKRMRRLKRTQPSSSSIISFLLRLGGCLSRSLIERMVPQTIAEIAMKASSVITVNIIFILKPQLKIEGAV